MRNLSFCLCRCVTQHAANTSITLAWLCGWYFISVWPFKRFLQGRGGREDNGSRHYLLLSCRFNIRPHTLWPSPIRMPSGCTCTHSPTRCAHVPNTYWHARAAARGQKACMQGQRSTSHTPTQSCAQEDACWGFALTNIFTLFPGSRCRDLRSLILFPAQSTTYHTHSTAQRTTCVETTIKQCRNVPLCPHLRVPLYFFNSICIHAHACSFFIVIL